MTRKGWSTHNPMATPMFEAMADAMLLEDSRRNGAILGAIDDLRETWLEEWGPVPSWDEPIATAYQHRNLALLRKVLDNRREAGLAVCRRIGIDPETGEKVPRRAHRTNVRSCPLPVVTY